MNRRQAAAAFGLAVLGSQAGHLLAYQVRFAGAAQQLQSTGAHSYFPLLAKALTGFAAAALLASLFVIALARILAGRPARHMPAPSMLGLVAAMFTLQLTFFAVQELVEAHVAGAVSGPGFELVLWGTIGQLPAALVAAAALRWLLTKVAPAAGALVSLLSAPLQPAGRASTAVSVPGYAAAAVSLWPAVSFNRRGPPSFS